MQCTTICGIILQCWGGLLLPSVLSGGRTFAESPCLGTRLLDLSYSLLPFTSGSRYMDTHTLLQFCITFYNCHNLEYYFTTERSLHPINCIFIVALKCF